MFGSGHDTVLKRLAVNRGSTRPASDANELAGGLVYRPLISDPARRHDPQASTEGGDGRWRRVVGLRMSTKPLLAFARGLVG
jgi:hypothetical protein